MPQTEAQLRFRSALSRIPDPDAAINEVINRLADAFDHIDFADIEFSRRFVVKSSDRRFAYDVCHPRMIEWLKEHADGFPAIEVDRGQLLLARDKKRWSPEEFEGMLGYAREFIDRWPDHLLDELGVPARAAEGLA